MGILERRAYSSGHLQLGRAVRHMRATQHVSQRRLADVCGMRWRDLARLERGRYRPTLHLLKQLAAALDGTLTALDLQVANEQYLAEVGGARQLNRSTAARRWPLARWRQPRRATTELAAAALICCEARVRCHKRPRSVGEDNIDRPDGC